MTKDLRATRASSIEDVKNIFFTKMDTYSDHLQLPFDMCLIECIEAEKGDFSLIEVMDR